MVNHCPLQSTLKYGSGLRIYNKIAEYHVSKFKDVGFRLTGVCRYSLLKNGIPLNILHHSNEIIIMSFFVQKYNCFLKDRRGKEGGRFAYRQRVPAEQSERWQCLEGNLSLKKSLSILNA